MGHDNHLGVKIEIVLQFLERCFLQEFSGINHAATMELGQPRAERKILKKSQPAIRQITNERHPPLASAAFQHPGTLNNPRLSLPNGLEQLWYHFYRILPVSMDDNR